MKTFPTQQQFDDMSKKHNLVPVVTEFVADTETPISAFMKLCGDKESAVLLESHLGGEHFDRYSFICFDPIAVFQITGNKVVIKEGGDERAILSENPLDFLRNYLQKFQQAKVGGLPDFTGGLVGYIGHEMVTFCDEVNLVSKMESGYPDAILMLATKVIAFDNKKHKIQVINNVDGNVSSYQNAVVENQHLVWQLGATNLESCSISLEKSPDFQVPDSNFSKEEYMAAAEKAKEYILAGDVIQVVLAQKFKTKISGNAFDLYRILRQVNPSRYMFYVNFGRVKLVGASPEILVRLKNGEVTLRPIAGTRKRTHDPKRDQALADELMNDSKERAEHMMLLDLGRNDVSRVCHAGTVEVTEVMVIERFSHVQHLVSNVIGQIKDGLDAFDAFKATFPQGTVTGAPKIRAMEIINELEPSDRGPYGGGFGYWGFNGNMDTCITIRTMSIVDDELTIQVGAGIVADSVLEIEWQETIDKAGANLVSVNIFNNQQGEKA